MAIDLGKLQVLHGALALSLIAGACAAEKRGPAGPLVREATPLETGAAQKERLCSRDRSDAVLDVFCRSEPPKITSLVELRQAFGVDEPGTKQLFALTGHSTSLVARSVSSINPRVIFIRPESETDGVELLFIAFARGEQFSEIAVRDRTAGELQFYLFTFDQECNERGCKPGDLLTEHAEVGWRNVNVYAEEDLANTPSDCRVCHQPDGPHTPKLLRMQEFEPPWNHWFYSFVPGGKAIIRDYLAAKGDEGMGGLTADDIALRSQPGVMSSTLFFANPGPQPNAYVSAVINSEITESTASLGGNQPDDNSVPGESETWDAIYERARNGEAISVPYHDVKVTDKAKLATMTAAYVDYREGRLPREELPDIREVFPDDEELLARMGFATEPGMTGQEVLMQACAQCHNGHLDQTLSRARFSVDLSKLSREQKDRAISRIMLPLDHGGVMPPARFRHLSEDAKRQLVELLEH